MNDESGTRPIKAAISGLSAARYIGLPDGHEFVRLAPSSTAAGRLTWHLAVRCITPSGPRPQRAAPPGLHRRRNHRAGPPPGHGGRRGRERRTRPPQRANGVVADPASRRHQVNGDTPLHLAVFAGRKDVVDALLAFQARRDLKNKVGPPTVHRALAPPNAHPASTARRPWTRRPPSLRRVPPRAKSPPLSGPSNRCPYSLPAWPPLRWTRVSVAQRGRTCHSYTI